MLRHIHSFDIMAAIDASELSFILLPASLTFRPEFERVLLDHALRRACECEQIVEQLRALLAVTTAVGCGFTAVVGMYFTSFTGKDAATQFLASNDIRIIRQLVEDS
jgi:hypothetical protein